MATPSKPTLTSSGTTSWTDNTTLLAADLQAYFDPLYNGFASLDNTNIASGAAIDPTKLAGHSDTAAHQKATTDPGTSASLSPPSTADLETETLRFEIERLAFGLVGTSHAVRYDGSGNQNVAWLDVPH